MCVHVRRVPAIAALARLKLATPMSHPLSRSCRAADGDGSVIGAPPLQVPSAAPSTRKASGVTPGQEQALHIGSGSTVHHPPPHPILCKVAEGAKLIVTGNSSEPGALSSSSLLLRGSHGCCAHLDYDDASGGILVNFVCDDTTKGAFQMDEASQGKNAAWAKPAWALKDKVRVHGMLNAMFDSLLHPEGDGDQPGLMRAGVQLSEVRAVGCDVRIARASTAGRMRCMLGCPACVRRACRVHLCSARAMSICDTCVTHHDGNVCSHGF